MTALSYVFMGFSLFATLFALAGAIATWLHRRKPRPAELSGFPPVSLLKPIKGLEEQLAGNLRSVFAQRYPGPLEVVFAAEDLDDPGLTVAREIAAEFPHIPSRFVRSDPSFGYNPKVSNLAAALGAASHDLVLQSDANVRLDPGYLRAIVSEFQAEGASLLSSIVIGDGEESIGAAMENLQLSARIVPSTCFALIYFRHTCVIGKSMLLRKSALAGVGDLSAFKDVLAEDYLLGQAFEAAGKKVVLSSIPVTNVNVHAPLRRFCARHARWLKMRALIHAPAFVADLIANPVLFALLAALTSASAPFSWGFFVAITAVKIAIDAATLVLVRGRAMRLSHLLSAPIKDVLLACLWPYAAVSRSVEWRGVQLRMRRGSVLVPVPKRARKLRVSNERAASIPS